jgi:hypothetical protein
MLDGSSSFTISGSTISNNTVTVNAASQQFQCGGGLLAIGGAAGQLSLSTISGNTAPYAGGICVSTGSLSMTNDSVSANSASANNTSGSFGQGGGIFDAGTMSIEGTTISGNIAPQGAGIYFVTGLGATVTNSTIAGNNGPGIQLATAGNVLVSFSTISGNAVGIGNVTFIGGLSLLGSIVAGNTRDCLGNIVVFLGYDLVGTDCPGLYGQYPPGSGNLSYGGPGVIFNVTNPMLGALQNNGGPTLTMAPQPGSPAIDAVGSTACPPPAVDQRGVTRPQGKSCDIGSVEVVGP